MAAPFSNVLPVSGNFLLTTANPELSGWLFILMLVGIESQIELQGE